MTNRHPASAIIAIALLSSCTPPGREGETDPQAERAKAAPRVKPRADASPALEPAPARAKSPRPTLRFTFRVAGGAAVPVMSSLDDSAEIVFEATDGETGEILRSETGRDGTYCEVKTRSGQGWIAEALLSDIHWEGGEDAAATEVASATEERAGGFRIEVEREDESEPVQDDALATMERARPVADVLSVSPAGSDKPFDASALRVSGQYTIIDFYSDHCGPCRRLAPKLEGVARSHSRVVLRKVNVDRPGSNGIDWGSPIVAQYGITSLPYVELYGPDGSLEGTGQIALSRIDELSHQR